MSVIIPAYNAEETIQACVQSVIKQNYPSDLLEVIVVDNNSTDRTDEIAREAGANVIYERDIQTSYAARNRGCLEARGEVIAFTDSDCIAAPDWLGNLAIHFDDDQITGVAGNVLDEQSDSVITKFSSEMNIFEHQPNHPMISMLTNNVAYRKRTLQEIGLFDEHLFTAGDVDLGWRVQFNPQNKIVYEPKACIYHKHRTTIKGMYRQFIRYGYSEVLLTTLYQHKHIIGFTPKAQLRQIVRQAFALFIYLASFLKRLLTRLFQDHEPYYIYKPLLLMIVETGSIVGKIKALQDTHLMKRNPFPSRPIIQQQRNLTIRELQME